MSQTGGKRWSAGVIVAAWTMRALRAQDVSVHLTSMRDSTFVVADGNGSFYDVSGA